MCAKSVSEGRQVYEVPTDVQALLDFKQKLLAGKPRTNAVSYNYYFWHKIVNTIIVLVT